MPEFAAPGWLGLLALLPAIVWLRLRSRPREGRFKQITGTALRCLALTALAVALAGPLKHSRSERTEVVFVLDVSHSIDRETRRAAIDLVNRALIEKAPAARVGLVVFGEQAATEILLRDTAESIDEISAAVGRGGTDIGRALEVAMSLFQSDSSRRVVLLSDGRENAGRARAAAAVARSIGVQIATVALQDDRAPAEVLVRNMSAPAQVRVHEPFNVEITVHSTHDGPGRLIVTRNAVPIADMSLVLRPGHNVITLAEQSGVAGLYEYEAVINGDDDGVAENNRFQTFVQVRGQPRVLHAMGEADWGRYVSEALRTQGLTVEEIPGTALPATMHALADYDLVILNNVSGFDMSVAKMALLEEYVRDAGGGLINLGGDRSYSAGGYYGTPVERLLPVTMDIKTEARIPTLAVNIVIDRSGSMSSQDKLLIAKAAAVAAIEVMNPLDWVSVLAFDDTPEWSVPPTEVGDHRAIIEQLRIVASGGGTELLLALREAYRVMREQTARVKHIIVLSDGLTQTGGGFKKLISDMYADGITVSTVAFGSDADRALMQAIAALGHGRHYFTDNYRNIPRIFTSETLVVSRDLLVEEPTTPQPVYPGEITAGFDADAFPVLEGYQRIFAKPAAQVLLNAGQQDPLLVSWHYGLGRAAAFTSDLAGRWGRHWVGWDEFPRFVAQLARWTMRRESAGRMLPRFSWRGTRGELVIDTLDRDDGFINGLAMRANVVTPDAGSDTVSLTQIAPGRYRGEFPVPAAGRYYFNLHGTAAGLEVGPSTFGLAVPYSTEYLDLGADHALLEDLARATGGQVLPLSARALPAILEPAEDAVSYRARIWWPALLLALGFALLELMVRKIMLPESWQRRLSGAFNRRRTEEPGYEELAADIQRVREQHLKALNEGGSFHAEDPAARARLYISRGRR